MENLPLLIEYSKQELTLLNVAESAKVYASRARSANTNRAYRSDWHDFQVWCESHCLSSLPTEPATVALYLSAKAGRLKTATLARRLTAIGQAHLLAGMPLDMRHTVIRETWKGIRNTYGTAQRAKRPLLTEDLRLLVGLLPDTLLGIRDRALLLLGFSGAFRRSELVGLDIEHLSFCREGLTVLLERSKTDQQGSGRQVGIPYGSNPATCPVRNLQDWLQASETTLGPLFRSINRHGQIQRGRLSDRAVALLVKRAAYGKAVADGLDALLAEEYSAQFAGHSLRAGLATSAAMAGVAEHSIMRQTGHKKAETLRKYIRMGTLFTENAAGKVGL